MNFREEFLTLLDVTENSGNLFLRLDSSDWFQVEGYREQVLEIQLIKCKQIQEKIKVLKLFVGELIYNYEFLETEKLFKILFEDFSEIEIACEETSENTDDLTIDELFLKFQNLDKRFRDENESSLKGWGKYGKLRNFLKFELTNDRIKWEKRRQFFQQSNTEKVEKAETVIKLVDKILNFIEQIDNEGK